MQNQQLKPSPITGLCISQVWCDILNFLAGISCIINGLSYRRDGTHGMVLLTGFAYCAINLLSLAGFCLSKKYGLEKLPFWFRVWMFPVLTLLFIFSMIFSWARHYNHLEYPIQFSVSLLGYTWYLILLVVLLCRKCGCCCANTTSSKDLEKTGATVQVRQECVENIYENDQGLKSIIM